MDPLSYGIPRFNVSDPPPTLRPSDPPTVQRDNYVFISHTLCHGVVKFSLRLPLHTMDKSQSRSLMTKLHGKGATWAHNAVEKGILLSDRVGAKANAYSEKSGGEAFWPVTGDMAADMAKAARILRSFTGTPNITVLHVVAYMTKSLACAMARIRCRKSKRRWSESRQR